MSDPEVLSEQVLKENGCLKTVKRYLKGIHPGRGVITAGLTGWETIEEKMIVKPTLKFNVIDTVPSVVIFTEVV